MHALKIEAVTFDFESSSYIWWALRLASLIPLCIVTMDYAEGTKDEDTTRTILIVSGTLQAGAVQIDYNGWPIQSIVIIGSSIGS